MPFLRIFPVLGAITMVFALTMLVPMGVSRCGPTMARGSPTRRRWLGTLLAGLADALGRVARGQRRGPAGARRHLAGGPGLDAAAAVRRLAPVDLLRGHAHAAVVHRRLFRGGLRADHHRVHRAHRAGPAAGRHQSVALLSAVAGRHGHSGAGRGDSAHAGHGRQPAVSRRSHGPHERRQAHAAHHRNRQGPVDGVLPAVAGLCAGLLAGAA